MIAEYQDRLQKDVAFYYLLKQAPRKRFFIQTLVPLLGFCLFIYGFVMAFKLLVIMQLGT